jgi:hypothetical protein
VVWSVADEWIYLLTPLHTVLPTVGLFNDDVMLGKGSKIGAYVARHRPRVIVVNLPSLVPRSSILLVLAEYYVPVYSVGPDIIYIERPTSRVSAAASRRHTLRRSSV